LTSFSRTIEDYNKLAKQELVPEKQTKSLERVKTFKAELSDYRDNLDRMKQEFADRVGCSPKFVDCFTPVQPQPSRLLAIFNPASTQLLPVSNISLRPVQHPLTRYSPSKQPKHETTYSRVVPTTPQLPKTRTPTPRPPPPATPSAPQPQASPSAPRPPTPTAKRMPSANSPSSRRRTARSTIFSIAAPTR
jgi:hypothetical protein